MGEEKGVCDLQSKFPTQAATRLPYCCPRCRSPHHECVCLRHVLPDQAVAYLPGLDARPPSFRSYQVQPSFAEIGVATLDYGCSSTNTLYAFENHRLTLICFILTNFNV